MSKHARRADQIQANRGRGAETGIQEQPPSAAVAEPAVAAAEETPLTRDALGKYWIAVIVWIAGFALLTFVELLAALFRR